MITIRCYGGKEVMSIERMEDKAIEESNFLKKANISDFHDPNISDFHDPNIWIPALKRAMNSRYHAGSDTILNRLAPDGDNAFLSSDSKDDRDEKIDNFISADEHDKRMAKRHFTGKFASNLM